MTGTHPLSAAVVAARANDVDALRRLVDWRLSGAARMVRAMVDVFERDRARLAVSGLADLDTAIDRPEVVDEALRFVTPHLADTREIRHADPATAQAALQALRVGALPPGLTTDQHTRLAELSARAAAIREVFVLVTGTGQLPVAMAPDTGLLVLVLPD